MDTWVVAAAAGAGYLAKFWQNVVKDRDVLSGSFSGNTTEDKSNVISKPEKEVTHKRSEFGKLNKDESLFRRRVRRQISESNSPNKEETPAHSAEMISDISHLNIEPAYSIASTSGLTENIMKENDHDFADKLDSASKYPANAWQPDFSPRSFTMGSGFGKSRSFNSKCSRRYYSVKPMTSLESCLIAQMYKQQFETEEYVFSSLPSTSNSAISPFLVTDGKQIISRANTEFSCASFESTKQQLELTVGSGLRETDVMDSAPNINGAGLIELPRKVLKQRGKVKHRRSSISSVSSSGKYFRSQGSVDSMIPFCAGIVLGIISTIVTHKREVDNLNELLKQSQNLVQDLQEELDMKDSLTVKDLTNEYLELQEMIDPSVSTKADEKEDFRSKIEAELEAELERLELNMNAACLERSLSGLSEIHPDLVGDLIQGELEADNFNHVHDPDHDTGSSSTNCTPPGKNAVSPKELSLRLHELIQSRLEEHIAELEIELQYTTRKLHLMEVEKMNSNRDMSYSDFESSSTQGSPTVMDHGNSMVQPLFMNLSGDALNAYNEAYDEFMKTAEVQGTPPAAKSKNKQIENTEVYSFYRSLLYDQIGVGDNGNILLQDTEKRDLEQLDYKQIKIESEEEEEEEEDDELGKLLIKQIVEKTRQGSPVVLNAQKMLRTLDEQLSLE
ncbi:uncharacterized protein [Aristolochia californica]|uniref:uncharacterized protein n=1 Tax=Aristolochia californica TaxID=171875 RepID=UPI0035DD5E9E